MLEYKYSVCLCVKHPACSASFITESLKIIPSMANSAGDLIGKDTRFERKAVLTFWSVKLHEENELFSGELKIDQFLQEKHEELKRHRDFFYKIIDEGGNCYLNIHWTSNTCASSGEIGPRTLWLIGGISLGVQLDIQNGPE